MARGDPGEATYTPEVSAEDLPRKLMPRMEPGPIGPALQQLGDSVDRQYQSQSATWAGDQVADFRLKALSNLEDMKAKAPAGDPGNFTEQYLGKFDQDAAPLVAQAGSNPYARQMVQHGLSTLRDTLATHSMEWEATQRVASQNDSLQDNLDKQLPLVRSHPEMADQVGSTLMDQINASRNDPATKLKFSRTMDTALTKNAALGMVDQNPTSVYSQLMGETTDPTLKRLIDPVARNEVLEAAAGGTVKQYADGALNAYRSGGPRNGQQAFAAVDGLQFPGTPDQQDALREKIRDQIMKGRGDLINEQQQKYGPQVLQVEEQLKSGNPAPGTRGQIWDLYNNNALEPHTAGAYLGEMDAAARKQADATAGMGLINDAWNGKYLLDPKDSDQKNDAATWFDQVTDKNNMDEGSQGWINLAAEFSRRTGMVPESVGGWARSVLVGSQDPDQVLSAVDAVNRVRQASPRGFPYLDDDHKLSAMVDSISNLTQAGVPPQQAVTIARENADRGETDVKRLDEAWKVAKPFGPSDAALDSVLTQQVKGDPRLADIHWYGNNVPLRPTQMQADYYDSVRAYFNHNGGNAQQAEASAARDIGNTWGLTGMNGTPEIVRYPPERIFRAPNGAPGLTSSDIRSDVEETVLKNQDAFQHWDEEKRALAPLKVDPANVHLVESPDTALTNGKTWGMAYQNDDGVLEALYGKNGKPLSFDMPVKQQDYTAMRTAARQKAIADADARYHQTIDQEKQVREMLQQDQLSFDPMGVAGAR
jgi:hypothetical protein